MTRATSRPDRLRVALTGGIAEGKTTVLGMLAGLGVAVGSADAVAAALFNDRVVQAELARAIDEPPPVDRTHLRAVIAADPARRRAVNAVLHPRIAEGILALDADVVEVPLLIEACLQEQFHRVWLVTCGPEEQMRRLVDRLKDERLARAMLSTQLPTEAKAPFADEFVRTNLPMADVHSTVERLARAARWVA